jgi:hypothetical protein
MIFIERSASDPRAPVWSQAQRIAVSDWLADPDTVLSPVLARWMTTYSPALTTLGKLELAEVNRRVSGRGTWRTRPHDSYQRCPGAISAWR